MSKKIHIPKIPHAFFKWYCKADRYEELHGDLEEFFYERVEALGSVKARLYYTRDVIRCCQPYAWKKNKGYSNSNIIMFKNYFKTSLRSMVRNPLSSFINVFGLSVAIGITLVVYTMIEFSLNLDKFHENKETVYLTTFFADREGITSEYGTTPAPIGEMMQQDFDQIQRMGRVKDWNVVIKYEDNVFQERIRMVDQSFLEMLTFPLQMGEVASLGDLNSIILSNAMALKYFGYDDPMGQEVLVKFSDDQKKLFKVAGVAEEFPKAHAISFDFLINFENWKVADPDFDKQDWGKFVNATLIQVSSPDQIPLIQSGMAKYQELQNDIESDWEIQGFDFEQLATLHENSAEIRDDISRDQADEVFVGLPIMGAFMLALACFNYINMAIGSATKRLKEIGVRKVVGANRGKVIIQFLAENVFLTFFAMILGLVLTVTVFLPWFSTIADAPLEISLLNGNMWMFLLIVLLFTGIASGIYPALYVSRFPVVRIFRGTVKFGKKNPWMKGFLCLQMILAFVFITMAVMFNQNSNYQAKRDWGYNQHGALYVELPDRSSFDQLNGALSNNSKITTITGSRDHVGKSISSSVIHIDDRSFDVEHMGVDKNYFETLELEITSGTTFPDGAVNSRKVLVNELFAKRTVLEDPVGKFFRMDSTQYQIIGVVRDFHAFNFYNQVQPMIFETVPKEDFRFLTMRVGEGQEYQVYEDVKEAWAELFPESPFRGGHQIDLWAKFYADLGQMKRFTRTVAMVAILLAALGLYGLVTLNVSGRIKEFSIRKILGANIKHISRSVTRQYLVITILALVLGAPLAFMLNLGLINMMFAYPLPNGQWGVGLAFVLLIIVMLVVFITQIRRVLRYNPANGLRSE